MWSKYVSLTANMICTYVLYVELTAENKKPTMNLRRHGVQYTWLEMSERMVNYRICRLHDITFLIGGAHGRIGNLTKLLKFSIQITAYCFVSSCILVLSCVGALDGGWVQHGSEPINNGQVTTWHRHPCTPGGLPGGNTVTLVCCIHLLRLHSNLLFHLIRALALVIA